MKRNQRKILMAAAIPVIAILLPSVSYATCSTPGIPDGPPTWDASVHVPRSATIGWGTDIGPNVTIGRYAHIGICGQIAMDGFGGTVGSHAKLGDTVIITNGGSVGRRAQVGDNVTINGTRMGSYDNVAAGGSFTNSTLTSHVNIGTNAKVADSSLGSYATTGTDATLTGASIAYRSDLGDGVTVDTGTSIGRYVNVDSGVYVHDNVTVGAYAHVCADVSSGMSIAYHDKYGCN
jgi:UDP-3-O-[3-hydroxymyristoyl] glucosamine N-acyltransferase